MLQEEIICVEKLVTQKLKNRSVKIVIARFCDQADLGTSVAAKPGKNKSARFSGQVAQSKCPEGFGRVAGLVTTNGILLIGAGSSTRTTARDLMGSSFSTHTRSPAVLK